MTQANPFPLLLSAPTRTARLALRTPRHRFPGTGLRFHPSAPTSRNWVSSLTPPSHSLTHYAPCIKSLLNACGVAWGAIVNQTEGSLPSWSLRSSGGEIGWKTRG